MPSWYKMKFIFIFSLRLRGNDYFMIFSVSSCLGAFVVKK